MFTPCKPVMFWMLIFCGTALLGTMFKVGATLPDVDIAARI